jgi:hypothetical protein
MGYAYSSCALCFEEFEIDELEDCANSDCDKHYCCFCADDEIDESGFCIDCLNGFAWNENKLSEQFDAGLIDPIFSEEDEQLYKELFTEDDEYGEDAVEEVLSDEDLE